MGDPTSQIQHFTSLRCSGTAAAHPTTCQVAYFAAIATASSAIATKELRPECQTYKNQPFEVLARSMLLGGLETMKMPSSHSPPSMPPMSRLVERVLPGHSQSTRRLRNQVLSFACNPSARSVLIRGPIGAGKSTVARLIGLLKRVAPLNVAEATRIAETDIKFDAPNRVSALPMTWYAELTLTGLLESLADLQLFGAEKGAYTGADTRRIGLFERAMLGRATSIDKAPEGAQVTGGVVFLDEIGDLQPLLQGKLLSVLSGGQFYRIGGEGGEGLQFHGVTITASWRDLSEALRPDLLSRVAPYVIEVPGLDERKDDFDDIFSELESRSIEHAAASIDRLMKVDPKVDREYWSTARESLTRLTASDRNALRQVAWNEHANVRGLATALERLVVAREPVASVVASLPRTDPSNRGGGRDSPRETVARLLKSRHSGGLLSRVHELEAEDREALKLALTNDKGTQSMLAQHLGIPLEKLASQVKDLGRRRVRASQ